LRTGFSACSGEEIVTMDSDCTYDPMEVIKLLKILRSGYDVVTGSPYHPKGEVLNVTPWRLFLSKTLSRMYWIILPNPLYTYTSCFRAYKHDVLARLQFKSNGFLAVTELLVSAMLQNAKVAEIPATLQSRRFGVSKLKVAKVVYSHLKYFICVIFWRITGIPKT
jgi:dolichol-phosphate mannosyltransferase